MFYPPYRHDTVPQVLRLVLTYICLWYKSEAGKVGSFISLPPIVQELTILLPLCPWPGGTYPILQDM